MKKIYGFTFTGIVVGLIGWTSLVALAGNYYHYTQPTETSCDVPITPPTPPSPPSPPPSPEPSPEPSPVPGGGGSGPAGPTVYYYPPTSTPPTPTPTPSPQPAPTPAPICEGLNYFAVDSGVIGDGRILVSWEGGAGTLLYGTDKDNLNLSVQAVNGIELTNLEPNHYWFLAFNDCSVTPLIDPLP